MTQLEMFDSPKNYFVVSAVSNFGDLPQVIKVRYADYETASNSARNTVDFLKSTGATTIFVSVTDQDGKGYWSYEQNRSKL